MLIVVFVVVVGFQGVFSAVSVKDASGNETEAGGEYEKVQLLKMKIYQIYKNWKILRNLPTSREGFPGIQNQCLPWRWPFLIILCVFW